VRARASRRPAASSVRRSLAPGVLVASVVLCGCGGVTAPDLFLVQRSGIGANAKLTLLVNEEGGVSCNGVSASSGQKFKLSDPQLVQARAIQEDLHDPATKHVALAPAAKSVLSYRVRDEDGSVSFSDNSPGQPPVFRRLALFVLQAAQQVCHLRE
jgi:hypothetical protein